MGCANSITTDPMFYAFNQEKCPVLKLIDPENCKSLNVKVTMHNGEKEIMVELEDLKLFFKMHVFMLLFHFFTEGLPKYDIDDADLPNECKS